MMSERTFDSNGESTKRPEKICSSNLEVDQVVTLRGEDAAIQHETYCIELLRRVTLHSDQDAWKILQEALPNAREQRLAYLLFHCGLSPKKIVNTYPQEFQDVGEISLLRHTIFEQLLHHLYLPDDGKEDVREVSNTARSAETLGETGEK